MLTFDSDYEPFFQPPGWIIGPIWLVLYTCMAVSIIATLRNREVLDNYWLILSLFIIHLALNLFWPSIFNSERYLLSLIMLVFMIVFTIIYAYLIYKTIPSASMLVWPYIAWITFAAMINVAYYLEAN